MALKPVTIRLDEAEYANLKEYLDKFGDPDINIAYVIRSYIRDLNRAMPLIMKSNWDLKNYFGLLGAWLKQFGSMTDYDALSKTMVNPWSFWGKSTKPHGHNSQNDNPDEKV